MAEHQIFLKATLVELSGLEPGIAEGIKDGLLYQHSGLPDKIARRKREQSCPREFIPIVEQHPFMPKGLTLLGTMHEAGHPRGDLTRGNRHHHVFLVAQQTEQQIRIERSEER